MRLIDADALIDCFEMRGDSDLGWHLYEVIDEINDAPTAYDVDKVMEEIENRGNYFIDPWVSYMFKKQSKDIVKRGGINE